MSTLDSRCDVRVVKAFLMTLPLFLLGCRAQPKAADTEHRLHIEAVEGCDSEIVVGSLAGKTYRLSPVRPEATRAVACYMPVGPEDVGGDLAARLDVPSGTLRVHSPSFDTEAVYTIESATEVKKK